MKSKTPEKKLTKVIGNRSDGVVISEDGNGVRFYIENGIRVTEPVLLVPGRGGYTYQKGELHKDFMTELELKEMELKDNVKTSGKQSVEINAFHGTRSNKADLTPQDFLGASMFGKGIYFTSSQADATKYASAQVMINHDLVGKASLLSDAIDVPYDVAKEALIDQEGRVIKAALTLNNPLYVGENKIEVQEKVFLLAAAECDVVDGAQSIYRQFIESISGLEQFSLLQRHKLTRIYRQIATLSGRDSLVIDPKISPKGDGATHYLVLDSQQVNIIEAMKVVENTESISNDDWLLDIIQNTNNEETPSEGNVNQERLRLVLLKRMTELKTEQEQKLSEWQVKTYKSNSNVLEFEGDGPLKHESISIGAVNENRKSKTIDAIKFSLLGIVKTLTVVADPVQFNAFTEELLVIKEQVIQMDKIGSLQESASEKFEKLVNSKIGFEISKGVVGSTPVSQLLREVVFEGKVDEGHTDQAQEPNSTLYDIEEYNLQKNGSDYFSFSVRIPGERAFTHWMTVVDGAVHEAIGVDDDTYHENEVIPTSPLVSIPAPSISTNDHLRPVLSQLFLKAINEKVGFPIDVPMLCEGREADKIAELKLALGYKWNSSVQDFLKDEPEKRYDEVSAPEGFRWVNGKGPIAHKWGLAKDGEHVAFWNYHNTKEEAVKSLKEKLEWDANAEQYRKDQEAFESDLVKRIRSGEAPTDKDIEKLELKAQARFDFLSPVVQRLFGINKLQVRKAMGDALYEKTSDMGTKTTWGNSKKALSNVASFEYEIRNEKSQNWWESDKKYSSIYLVGKSKSKDYLTIKKEGEYLSLRLVSGGTGGEYTGTSESARDWLKSRLAGLGNALADKDMTDDDLAKKLRLVKGENNLFADGGSPTTTTININSGPLSKNGTLKAVGLNQSRGIVAMSQSIDQIIQDLVGRKKKISESLKFREAHLITQEQHSIDWVLNIIKTDGNEFFSKVHSYIVKLEDKYRDTHSTSRYEKINRDIAVTILNQPYPESDHNSLANYIVSVSKRFPEFRSQEVLSNDFCENPVDETYTLIESSKLLNSTKILLKDDKTKAWVVDGSKMVAVDQDKIGKIVVIVNSIQQNPALGTIRQQIGIESTKSMGMN